MIKADSNMKKYDLHNHTMLSKDGAIDARELIDLAISRNLQGIGICDHDEFPDENLYEYASAKDIKLALGIEFSCEKAHIIGYNLKHINTVDKKLIEQKFAELRNDYIAVADTMINALSDLGIKISRDKVQNIYNINKPQKLFVMKYLSEHLDLGFNSWSEARKWLQKLEEDRQVKSNKKGAKSLKPIYYPKDGSGINQFDPLEIIDLIHRSGGYAIWAHPFITPENVRIDYLNKFADRGIDAVEANYAYQQNGYIGNESNKELEEVVRAWLIERNIHVSGGSDSHFPLKTYNDQSPIMPGDFGINQDEAKKIDFIFR
jgi:3',5'-nucleoside bisphosphate phosphatase